MGRHCKYLTPEFEKLVEDELAKKRTFDSTREKLQIMSSNQYEEYKCSSTTV
jgi:hypothetical protein